jgi:hypothetical protein
MSGKAELETRNAKKPGAKRYSLFAQIFSGTWIVVLTVLKGLKLVTLETQDIIYTGIAVAAIFSPVYFSIFLDKIRDIRLAK